MVIHAFELDKEFVREELHRGNFDCMEIVGAVEETQFFRTLLDDAVLGRLACPACRQTGQSGRQAEAYPSPRKKEEVPLWLYLASQLTLRLHGARGYGGYPYILHSCLSADRAGDSCRLSILRGLNTSMTRRQESRVLWCAATIKRTIMQE